MGLTRVRALFGDDSGATAIEYGLIAALVAVALITIITTVGDDLLAVFTSIATALESSQ